MKRRDFVQGAVVAGTSSTMGAGGTSLSAKAPAAGTATDDLPRLGPKPVVRGKKAVASSQHPIVTETMLAVMREGGSAVDAALAGCLVQATIREGLGAQQLRDSGFGPGPLPSPAPNLGVLIPAVPPCAAFPASCPEGLGSLRPPHGLATDDGHLIGLAHATGLLALLILGASLGLGVHISF